MNSIPISIQILCSILFIILMLDLGERKTCCCKNILRSLFLYLSCVSPSLFFFFLDWKQKTTCDKNPWYICMPIYNTHLHLFLADMHYSKWHPFCLLTLINFLTTDTNFLTDEFWKILITSNHTNLYILTILVYQFIKNGVCVSCISLIHVRLTFKSLWYLLNMTLYMDH